MTERMSARQYREAVAKPQRGNKFGAKKTTVDGITFDSRRESEVYADLLNLQRAGDIKDLIRQPAFNLIVNGELVGRFTADFSFTDLREGGRRRVIDVKGVVTREFKRTRKIIKAIYKIEVEVWK